MGPGLSFITASGLFLELKSALESAARNRPEGVWTTFRLIYRLKNRPPLPPSAYRSESNPGTTLHPFVMKKFSNAYAANKAAPSQPGTRRDFFRQAALASAGLLAAGSGLLSCRPKEARAAALPAGGGGTVVTRRNIAALAPDDQNVLMLREAVRVMKQRSDANQLDPVGWLMNGTLHSLYCATSNYATQVHYSWLFFPWHRAYLSFLEKQMQAAINEPGFALPYWDWTKTRRMPAHYFGQGNPLHDRTRESLLEDEIPADFIDVGPALRAPRFSSFGGFEKGNPEVPQVEGIVEQSFHNNVHNWIGGNMGAFPTATLDPIFSGHHGNLDRLWSAWLAYAPAHKNPDDFLWLNYEFGFYDPKGQLTRIAVKDTLDTESLGYRFDTLDFTQPGPAEMPKRGDATAFRRKAPASAPVEVPGGKRQQVADALATGRKRVILRFERMQLTAIPLTIRVFLDHPGVDARTEPSGSGFVGTFTMLPVGSPEKGLERVVTMQMEVGPELAELVRNGKPIAVSLVPVPLRDRRLPTETIQVSGATLVLDE